MNPYRDDRHAMTALLEAAERRAQRAEERAEAAEARAKRAEKRVKRLGLGALPNERVPVRLRARRVFARDGEADLELTVVIGLAEDDEARTAAARQFIDATGDDLATAAAPLLETALRRVIAMRSTVDIERALGGLAEDVRATAAPALRDLGLELGTVLLAPLAGTVERDGP